MESYGSSQTIIRRKIGLRSALRIGANGNDEAIGSSGVHCCPAYRNTSSCDCGAWLAGLAGIALVATIVLLAILVFQTSDARSTTKYGIQAVGSECRPGPGDADAIVEGSLVMNSNQKFVDWSLLVQNLGTITSISIEGPLSSTDPNNGPTKISLCGFPSPDSCDQISPIEGELTQLETGESPRPAIQDIQEDSPLYYLIIRTVDFPNCAVRVGLFSTY